MTIDFTFPNSKHPNSPDLSVLDLAIILEAEYNIIEQFCEDNIKQIIKSIIGGLKANGEINLQQLNADIKDLWYRYGSKNKFNEGISLKAQKEGRPAFVDTSTYMLGMMPDSKLNDDEKRLKKTKHEWEALKIG